MTSFILLTVASWIITAKQNSRHPWMGCYCSPGTHLIAGKGFGTLSRRGNEGSYFTSRRRRLRSSGS